MNIEKFVVIPTFKSVGDVCEYIEEHKNIQSKKKVF